MSFIDAVRRLLPGRARQAPADPAQRRDFFRRMGGASLAAAVGGGLLMPDEAWAAVEERAARYGIVPGTLVDAEGRPRKPSSMIDNPFLGTIVPFGFDFAPTGWAMCNGQILPIQGYTALFSLLGTTYGGNGQTNFALPNLRSRAPLHFGQGPGLSDYVLGQMDGVEAVTLTVAQMPAHNHPGQASASTAGTTPVPTSNIPAMPASSIPQYAPPASADGTLAAGVTGITGGSQPVGIIPPYLALNFCIALQGQYPSRP